MFKTNYAVANCRSFQVTMRYLV